MHAIILAGSSQKDEFAIKHGASNKALIDLNGRPMFDYVFRAVRDSEIIKDIVIVGPESDFAAYRQEGVSIVPDREDLTDTCLAGLASLPDDGQRVLVITSDLPLVTPAIIDSFLSRVSPLAGDLFYPLISREVNEARFPGMRRTYARLKEGVFTGGNVMVLNPAIAAPVADVIKRLVSQRKNVLGLAMIAGPITLLRLALGHLTIAQAERKLGQVLRCHCVAVRCEHAEIGTDVDKESDLQLALATLVQA